MKSKEVLFSLIKSLNRNEKRYFLLFSSLQAGDKTYLQLFEAIEKQQVYNEASLLKQFENTAVGNNFSYNKGYLFQVILKSMRAYRSEASANMQLKGLLSDVEFLYEKGLYMSCGKIVAKAKKLAEKYEKQLQLLELLYWEVKLLETVSYAEKTEEDMEQIFSKMFEVTDKFCNANEYWRLLSRIIMKHTEDGFIRKQADISPYQNIMSHSLLNQEHHALSYRAKYFYYTAHSVYLFIRNDFQGAIVHSQKIIELMEEYPHYVADNPALYATILGNIIVYHFNLKQYEEVLPIIEKLKSIKTNFKRIYSTIFYLASSLELTLYIGSGQFEKGLSQIAAIQAELDKPNKRINKLKEILLYYEICCIYFGMDNYPTANTWINKILNDARSDARSDVLCFAQLLHLIIHFEKHNEEYDNRDYISYRVITANGFLKKREKLYQVEKEILDFFRKELPKINTKKEQINAFKKLRIKIEEIVKDSYEKRALEYFDFISWIESKIEGRRFGEVVRGKLKKT